MAKEPSKCLCIVDTDGLHGIATASGNLKTTLIECLKSGVIGVPACAWKEFEDLFEEEAAELKAHITTRIIMKRAFYVGAASIADKLNSGFPRGAYDDNIELLCASIASTQSFRIPTSPEQMAEYDGMDCDVSDLATWVDEQTQ